MTTQHRKHRGYATQRLVADWFRRLMYPFAESTGAGRCGADLTGTPGIAVEVKATPGDNTGALMQAIRNADGSLAVVVWRPNGYGPECIADWPAILRLEDFTRLAIAAGYGSDLDALLSRHGVA